ncbi:HupE/UreJ family protein [Nonlabens ponticola]|uniref:HupE/UreJ family protein n=1 Tax=Nonlabens ponticola TaxID=2496866 RepID=A0A3S9MWL0_9FLAO|nr:HupE/UreJ family protein [Nonlabens ponticola]AZQ43509.1 HupE/UreJ family protein [Nonlabens ponticola]
MDDLITNFLFGFWHVLDLQAYDHILFITLLAMPFLFNSWRKLLLLVTAFTIGHSISLLLVVYGKVTFATAYIEFLIPVTIAVTALYNIFTAGRRHRDSTPWLTAMIALFFGLIHGFGFSSAFKMLASGSDQNTLLLLLEFALGIEAAQLVIVLIVLTITFIFTGIFRFNKKEWTQIISAIILGIVIPMLIDRWIW